MPHQFEEGFVAYLFKSIERKKIEHPSVKLQFQDAKTIEIETEKENDEFFDLQQKFNEIDNIATEQKKKQNKIIDLVDHVLDKNNSFNDIKTYDIYIEDGLFKEIDSK